MIFNMSTSYFHKKNVYYFEEYLMTNFLTDLEVRYITSSRLDRMDVLDGGCPDYKP